MSGSAPSVFPVPAQVYVRLRPPNVSTAASVGGPLYSVDSENSISVELPDATETQTAQSPDRPPSDPSASFRVSGKVFDANTGNTALYVNTLQPLVLSSTEGISSLVIAYGTSGSGKSHSLFGSLQSPGLIFSALSDLFSHIASYNNSVSASAKPVPSAIANLPWAGSPVGATKPYSEGPHKAPLEHSPGGHSTNPFGGTSREYSPGPSEGTSTKLSGGPVGGSSDLQPKGSCKCPCAEAGVLGCEFSVCISSVEIRGEEVGDLLGGCEGLYWPGQRLPPVDLRASLAHGNSREGHGLFRQVDVATLEEAVQVVARAAAFKKARDLALGSEGANFLLRLSVERAYCLICPQHSPATEAATADGKSTGTMQVDENRHTKTADPKNAVTVLKADITFFEAAGVETLLHQPSGRAVNRSLFYLTECLLRLSESPEYLDSFDWGSSAATSLLRSCVEGPSALLLLTPLSPCPEALPPSLAVLRLANAVSNICKNVQRQFIQPQKSRLFLLHRLVLRETEALFLGVSLLRRHQQLLRLKRQNEWWLPTTEERLRDVGERREKLKQLQDKILVGGEGDWRLLEGSRVVRLCRMLELLQGNNNFISLALAEEAPMEDPCQLKMLPVGPPKAPKTRKASPTPPNVPPISLKTKDKPVQFTPIAEVPIHLWASAKPAAAKEARDDPINLTALHFGEDEEESPYAGEVPHYPGERPNYTEGGPPYPPQGFGSAAIRRLFSNEHQEGSSPGEHTPQASGATGPPSDGETGTEQGLPQQRRHKESLQREAPRCPDDPALEFLPHQSGSSTPMNCMALAAAETAAAAVATAAAAGGFPGNGCRQPAESRANQLGVGALEEELEGAAWGQLPAAGPPSPLSVPGNYAMERQGVSPPATPLSLESEATQEGDDEGEHQRLFFKVQLRLKASPPLAQGSPKRASPERPQQQQQQQLVVHCIEEIDHENRRANANLFTPRFSTKGDGNGNNPLQVASKGHLPSTSTGPHTSSSSSSSPNGGKDSSKGCSQQGLPEEGRTKLLRDATALRSEVLSLIQDSPTEKPWGAPRFRRSPTPKRDPCPSPPIHCSNSEREVAPCQPAGYRNSREGSSEGRPNTRVIGPPQHHSRQSVQTPDWGSPQGPGSAIWEGGVPAPNLYCVHAHVPLSPSNVASPCWGPSAHQGAPSPQHGCTQVIQMPCAFPPSPWVPPATSVRKVTRSKDRPAACMQQRAAEHQQTARDAQVAGLSREPPKIPQLTEADRRLPHFRAGKGGASWEVPASRSGTAAARVAAAGAKATGAVTGEDEGNSFCLPEEPTWRCRPADSKSDLLLQSSLRPWTRRGRSPASASVPAVAHRGKERAKGPTASQSRTPAREAGKGSLEPARGPHPAAHAARPPQTVPTFQAAHRRQTARAIPHGMPLPHAVYTPQPLGFPGHFRAPIFVPSIARGAGAPLVPPKPYELQFKGQAVLCGGSSDRSSSSGGPPSTVRSSAPTERGDSDGIDSQKEIPRSSAQPVASPAAAAALFATRAAVPITAAPQNDFTPPAVTGAILQGRGTSATISPQPSPHEQQHAQQRVPQQQQKQHHQQQIQEQQQQQNLQQQQQQSNKQSHQQQQQLLQQQRLQQQNSQQQHLYQQHLQNQNSHQQHSQQQHLQPQHLQQQHLQQQNSQQKPTERRVEDDRASGARGLPSIVGEPPSLHASNSISESVSRPTVAAARSACISERVPGSLGAPSYPQTGGVSSREAAAGGQVIPSVGRAASPVSTYRQEGAGLPSNPAAYRAASYRPDLHSPAPTTTSCEGRIGGPSEASCRTSAPWSPAFSKGPWGPCGDGSGNLTIATCWTPRPPVPPLPARIVNIVKRTRDGIAADFALDSEKRRTVYPPEKPLNIPLPSYGQGGQASGSGAYYLPYERGCVNEAATADAVTATVWDEAAARGRSRTLGPQQAWVKPVFFPGVPQGEWASHPSSRPEALSADPHMRHPTASAWGPHGAPSMPQGAGSPTVLSSWGPQRAGSGSGPTDKCRGLPRGQRSCSVGPSHAPVRGSAAVRTSSSSAAVNAACANGHEEVRQGDSVPMVPAVSTQEDIDANCFEDCLALLNARVGRAYHRRPHLPPGQTLAAPPPCPFRRRRSASRAANRGASAPTVAAAKRTGDTGGSCVAPRGCELTVSCGVGSPQD